MKRINVILTTKNRLPQLEVALHSIKQQTRTPDRVIIVSDSDNETYSKEEILCHELGYEIVRDMRSHNLAGSLNTGIDYLIKDNLSSVLDYKDWYVTTLDDDDYWEETYLEKCSDATKNNEDFVISGIIYHKDNNEIEKLSIPQHVDIYDFLKGNPHLQGSNTFANLRTLLMAGSFDENISASTDRNFYASLMMLKPTYSVVNEYLVHVDGTTNHERITNNRELKIDAYRKFYHKYGGLMNPSIEESFFNRINTLFNITKSDIHNHKPEGIDIVRPSLKDKYTDHLIVGFTATNHDLGLRLLRELINLHRDNMTIVILINFLEDDSDYWELVNKSNTLCSIHYIYDNLHELSHIGLIPEYYHFPEDNIVREISISRSILYYFVSKEWMDDSVALILDDDMELSEITKDKNNTMLVKQLTNLDNIIETYKDNDAAVFGYSGDAPVPLISTLRTSLVDYVFAQLKATNGVPLLDNYEDYYYDLSFTNSSHLETPIPLMRKCKLDEIFLGKANSRYLFNNKSDIYDITSCGGNVIIYNKELLNIPNYSFRINNLPARRGDYYWTQLAKSKGYHIVGIPYSTLHNRLPSEFDFKKEMDKFYKDLVGAAATHSLSNGLGIKPKEFAERFTVFAIHRLVLFIESYFRIIGLLSIVNDEKYSKDFNESNLSTFTHNTLSMLNVYILKASYRIFRHDIYLTEKRKDLYANRPAYKKLLDGGTPFKVIGSGVEAAIYGDPDYIYKCFYKPLTNEKFLTKVSPCFKECPVLYPIKILHINDKTIIRYHKEKSKPYKNKDNYIDDLVTLIAFCREHGFLLDNIKKENFIVVDNHLKYIDYGESIIPYSEEDYVKFVKRIYEMIHYYFLNDYEYKVLIEMSYDHKTEGIDSGWGRLELLSRGRTKVDIHDQKIIDLVNSLSPKKILDYGAGKCQIANALSKKYSTDVFDVDTEIIHERHAKRVKVYNSVSEIPTNTYDLVLNNLVLCTIDNKEADKVLFNISQALKTGGHLIVSFCNPFFNNIEHTETRNSGLSVYPMLASTFTKVNRDNTNTRLEYHRPIETYINLLQRNGFKIEKAIEDDGVDRDTLNPISEHIILDCVLVRKPIYMDDCSLLIKTNPMDYRDIYKCIRHIVLNLEKGNKFAERLMVIDNVPAQERARAYSNDSLEKLEKGINKAIINGLIDRVVYANDDQEDIAHTYQKYFGVSATNGHGMGGEGTYASLYGFDSVSTRYVYQTDYDIIYSIQRYGGLNDTLNLLKEKDALTISLGCPRHESIPMVNNVRIEVRSSFIDLTKLNQCLPLKNSIVDDALTLSWYRSVDESNLDNLSYRCGDNDLFFIHPDNEFKKDDVSFLDIVRNKMEKGEYTSSQENNISLTGDLYSWCDFASHETVIFTRGRNTTNERIKRMLDSLKPQSYQNFNLVYVDDCSTNGSSEYINFILTYDEFFKDKSIYVRNSVKRGSLYNVVFALQNIITNKDSIVINIDSDDYLCSNKAIERIVDEFHSGVELTIGNCIRRDKPLKQYSVVSFDRVWEREGDNVWLHPKCYRRYLFDYVDIENDLKIDGKYVYVNTDFAVMLPMIEVAKKCSFISDVIYYYEPCDDNMKDRNVYERNNKLRIRQILLDKARERHHETN